MASTVLIAVDKSSNAEHCANWYLERLHRPGNKVIVVHAPDYWSDAVGRMSPARLAELYHDSQQVAKELAQKYTKIFQDAGVSDVQAVIEEGRDPWQVICAKAEHARADMIVIGSRGMGTIRRTLVGSVSDGVVHHSHVPVIVVKEKK